MPLHIALTTEPITAPLLETWTQRLSLPSCGALASFCGRVRNHSDGKQVSRLGYEAYVPMALRCMEQIACEIETAFAPVQLIAAHRIGELAVGEISIAVIAAAPHRREAFAAMQRCVDRIKAEVPIWKKEFFTDGSEPVWVNCSCVDHHPAV